MVREELPYQICYFSVFIALPLWYPEFLLCDAVLVSLAISEVHILGEGVWKTRKKRGGH